eukprot:3623226-Alexandrium_andersonii.AAC.1
MSASLVGSEMCIRDRSAKCCSLVVHVFSLVGHFNFCELGLLGLNTSESVSYTHLTLPTICSV